MAAEQPLSNGVSAPADVVMKDDPATEPPHAFADPPPATSTTPPGEPPPSSIPEIPAPTSMPTGPPPPSTAAATARASPQPKGSTTPAPPPSHPSANGSTTRVYLNTKVTPHLLEVMKEIAAKEPEKPLQYLAEFFAQRSQKVEGN